MKENDFKCSAYDNTVPTEIDDSPAFKIPPYLPRIMLIDRMENRLIFFAFQCLESRNIRNDICISH